MSKSRRQRCENGSRTGKFHKRCPKAGGSDARMDPEQENFIKYVQKPAAARREWIQNREISQKMSKSWRQQGENGSRAGKFHKICPKTSQRKARMDPEPGNFPKHVQKLAAAGQDWILSREITQKMSKSHQAQDEIGSRTGKYHKRCPKESKRRARFDPEQGNITKNVLKPASKYIKRRNT